MSGINIQERFLKKISEFGSGISKALNFPFGIFTEKGKIIVAAGWKEIFSDFYLKICSGLYEADYLETHKIAENVYVFPTRNHMHELAISISINGGIASWVVCGPFIYDEERKNLDLIYSFSSEFGLKKQYYLSLIHSSPIIPKEKLNVAINLIQSAIQLAEFNCVGDKLYEANLIEVIPVKENASPNPLGETIDINTLQTFQDNFSFATGVSSIVLDTNGKNITQPTFLDSNPFFSVTNKERSSICCEEFLRFVADKAYDLGFSDVYICPKCKRYISSAPLLVNKERVANWFIAFGDYDNNISEHVLSPEDLIDLQPVKFTDLPSPTFESTIKLLSHIALRFADLTKNNFLLSNEIRDRINAEIKFQDLNGELESRVIQRTHLLEEALEELRFENEERRRTEIELYNAQEEIKAALEREKELHELKSRFVSMVSHEYRSPLTFIMSSTYLIEQFHINGDSEKIKTNLEKMRKSIGHMSELLKDVLYIGRLESGRFSVSPESIELIEFVKEIIDQVKSETTEFRNIRLSTTSDIISIVSDKNLLRQVITNLLVNAIKYSPNHSEVVIGVHEYLDRISLNVTDKGIGIDEDDMAEIFEPFQRGTNVGKISGSGLGLAILKKCVDALNAEVTVSSEINMGSTFSVSLPKAVGID